jgi:hypothetical protein
VSPEIIETLAIRAALGNNGGAWAEHYTNEQKEHWRRFVQDLVADAAHREHIRCMDIAAIMVDSERERCAKIAEGARHVVGASEITCLAIAEEIRAGTI